jgi:hypothetical protein
MHLGKVRFLDKLGMTMNWTLGMTVWSQPWCEVAVSRRSGTGVTKSPSR